jgi:hypothetical protein
MTIADMLLMADDIDQLMAVFRLAGINAVIEDINKLPHVYIPKLRSAQSVPDRFCYLDGKPVSFYGQIEIARQPPNDYGGWNINRLFELSVDHNGDIS